MIKNAETGIPLPIFIKGKVRDVYDLAELSSAYGDKLLIVSSDRISAYDLVLPTLIPNKGKILNQISKFWFAKTRAIVKNHFLTDQIEEYPSELFPYKSELEERSMLVIKTEKIPIECVVRGYLSGSAWKDYCQTGKVCGIFLPSNLEESQKLPEPIFTPATKEEGGRHDRNISFEEMAEIIGSPIVEGSPLSEKLREISITLFRFASRLLEKRGLILADTKFEFGLKTDSNGKKEILLIDECLTPDSSRLWDAPHQRNSESVREFPVGEGFIPHLRDKTSWTNLPVGGGPPSFDKQFVRNYLDSIGWNRKPPAPALPETIVRKTEAKYQEALERIVHA